MAQRAGVDQPLTRIISIYGTADAGVLGMETPLSATIRKWLSGVPAVMKELFGSERIPSLFQYDPLHRCGQASLGLNRLGIALRFGALWRRFCRPPSASGCQACLL